MKVINFTQYANNPYTRLMYSALVGKYEPIRGTIDEALGLLRRKESTVFHINWEEHLIRGCPTSAEAELMGDHFLSKLHEYRRLGGKVLWTVHNEYPHELEHTDAFLRLRGELGKAVDRILVHSVQALAVLQAQMDLDSSLVFLVPHPSYWGEYEPISALAPKGHKAKERLAIAFGMVRPYKGYSAFLKTVAEATVCSFKLKVVGAPIAHDPYGEELKTQFGSNPRIDFDYRSVPSEDVATTIRSGRCLVLPYERFLTSGVALLGITLGVPVVAPDTPQMREFLPPANHCLLFDSKQTDDVMNAIERAMDLSDSAVNELRRQHHERAQHFSPQRVSRRLGDLFDSL